VYLVTEVLKQNLSNIINYIIITIILVEILQLSFIDESALNEVMLDNVRAFLLKDHSYSERSATIKVTYASKIPSMLR